jgi:hypothetical protein
VPRRTISRTPFSTGARANREESDFPFFPRFPAFLFFFASLRASSRLFARFAVSRAFGFMNTDFADNGYNPEIRSVPSG